MSTQTEQATMAQVRRALSDEVCRLNARIDQLSAAQRDLLTPVANIPDLKGDSSHGHHDRLPP